VSSNSILLGILKAQAYSSIIMSI